MKNHKIVKNATATVAKGKISMDLDSLEFKKKFDVCFTKFKSNHTLHNKNKPQISSNNQGSKILIIFSYFATEL